MRVQSEAVQRGRLRPVSGTLVVALFALLTYLYYPTPAPNVPQPTSSDCLLLHMWSNGYHSDLGVPTEVFPPDHPLRRMFPDASSFLIGWGDEKFYRSDGTNLWLGLDALIPPSPSVMHVAYNAAASSAYLGPNDDAPIAVSREGAAELEHYIDRALVLDPQGNPIIVAPGKVIGRSEFLRTRGSFHLFNVCNQWLARALRAAGVDVNARAAWLAGGLIEQVHKADRAACPA
ncbi:MAG: DUF2459 domain-containing protein [Vitreimonas sp.]